MEESKIEKIINKLQLLWFIVDSLKDGYEVDKDIIDKAYNSLDEIKSLLYGCEKERKDVLDFIEELRSELKGDTDIHSTKEKIKIISKLKTICNQK